MSLFRQIVGAIVFICLLSGAKSEPQPNIPVPDDPNFLKQAAIEANKRVVKALQPQLPKKLDEHTTMNSVTAGDLLLLYTYQIDLPKNNINTDILRKTVLENVCNAEIARGEWHAKLTKAMLDVGYVRKYTYFDRDNIYVVSFDFDRYTCHL